MITVETPLRAIQSQRAALEQLMMTCTAEQYTRIEGALVVLDWLEHGEPSPVEGVL